MANISINVLADVREAQKNLKSIADTTTHVSSTMDKAKGAVKNLVGGFLGLEVANKIADGLKDCYNQATSFNKQVKITNVLVGHAGKGFGVTSKSLVDYADKTSLATGQTSQSILQVIDNVVKFGDITGKRVKEATTSVENIAAASGKSATMVSRTFNKALSDPVKGLTTLNTLGIHFTDKQTAQITKLSAAGKTAAAQQIILNQSQKQFGGIAAKSATPMAKLHALFEKYEILIGNKLVPVVNKFAAWLGKELPKAIAYLTPKLKQLQQWFIKNKNTFIDVGKVLKALFKFWVAQQKVTIKAVIVAVKAGIAIFQALKSAFNSVKNTIGNDWNKITGFFKSAKSKISHATSGMFDGIKNAFKEAVNFIISGWNNLHFTLPGFNTHIPGVGKVGGFTINTPNIPELAKGGIVSSPTLALVGERGPEAIVPLGRKGMGDTYVINVYTKQTLSTDKDIRDLVINTLKKNRRLNGSIVGVI